MLALQAPSPSPDTRPVELWEASPGLTGFMLGFFVLAVLVGLLAWSMQKHIRIVKHNARRLEDEAAGGAEAGRAASTEQVEGEGRT